MTNSIRKGKAGEQEWASFLKEHGFVDARRSQQYAGTHGDSDVISSELQDFHMEIKRVEKLNIDTALEQAIRDSKGLKIPIVCHRKNRGDWNVTLPATHFLQIVKAYLAGRA